MLRYGLICVLCCLLVGSHAVADVKLVITRDPDREIIGEVTETSEGIEVRTSMGVVTIPRHQVVSITDYVAPEEEFRQRLADLADDDVDAHISLGRSAMDDGMLEAAQERFRHVLQLEPDNQEAILLLGEAEARIMRRDRVDDEEPPETGPGGNEDSSFDPDWLVSMEDIYRIRMAELREDESVNVQFMNDVLDRFERSMTGREDADGEMFEARQFRRMRPPDKLTYILANIDRDNTSIRSDIHILDDPEFMQTFMVLWRTLEPTCAAAQCHGGVSAPGGLRLLRSPSVGTSDDVGRRTLYTNFMILDTYRAQSAEHNRQQLINRSRPENSLLLQFGLPTDQAVFAHAEVEGEPIRPLFANTENRLYQRMFEWLTDGLRGPVHPHYNVDFTPPLPSSTDEPPDEQPPDELPSDELPSDELPSDEQPSVEQPPDEPPADENTDS